MIKLDVNKGKELTFEVEFSGVSSPDEITSKIRLNINNVELSFPGKVKNEEIVVNIPALSKVLHTQLEDETVIPVNLEVIIGDNYFVPWRGEVKLTNGNNVSVKLKESSIKEIKVKSPKETNPVILKEEKKINKPKKINNDNIEITKEQIFKYMEKCGTKNPTIQNMIYEQAEVAAKSSKPIDVLRQIIKVIKKQ